MISSSDEMWKAWRAGYMDALDVHDIPIYESPSEEFDRWYEEVLLVWREIGRASCRERV